MLSRAGLKPILLAAVLGCLRPSEPEPQPQTHEPAKPTPERIDVHVHLVDDATDELLASMDRQGIARAVVIASPHLDPAQPPPPGSDAFAGWRRANDRLLELTLGHRGRLLPFITVELGSLTAAELDRWLEQGACGVKLYAGHQKLHPRPLDDPANAASFELLEQRRVPVLLHVNTVRFEAELDRLLASYPQLSVVCAHLCGARTDLDRLARILQKHPSLRVDTSHGGGVPGVQGFTQLERERDRLRGMIEAEPSRFLFGSDLVTMLGPNPAGARLDWDRQLAANLGLLEAETFEFLRTGELPTSLELGEYAGLALTGSTRDAVVGGNARTWLSRCVE